MTVLAEVGAFLQAQGIATLQTDLFRGALPDAPDACGVLYEYSGGPSELGFGVNGVQFETSAVQVVFRGAPDDYDGPRARAEQAYRALATVQARDLSGAAYLLVTPQQAPFLLERDGQRRVLIACNYLCNKRPSP